jgi:microsomal dipeptidase-like Zn-dependent dipeptidase
MKLSAGDRALKGDALKLLARIDEGVREFTPEGESSQALEGFQAVVTELRRLDRRGYFNICGLNFAGRTQSPESQQSRVLIDRVRIDGGLTPKGRAVLKLLEDQVGMEPA